MMGPPPGEAGGKGAAPAGKMPADKAGAPADKAGDKAKPELPPGHP